MKKLSIISLFLLLLACTSTTEKIDSKFVGQWKFYKGISNNKTADYMNGVIYQIKKVEGTKETYSFSFFEGDNNFLFSVKDNDTLISVNANCKLIYDEETQCLIFKEHNIDYIEWEFTKLK